MAAKRFLSVAVMFIFLFSNFALAEFDPSYYEGRPIDPSKEGIEYYREGDTVVYPSRNSDDLSMERFKRGEYSEEEMRRIAKEKMGDRFSEMDFKRGMLESRQRMDRDDAFSYKHEGFEERYYQGPSYEGYSKEHMIYGMLFEHISDEVDPREIKQQCSEPEKIADDVISKVKEKIGSFTSICDKIDKTSDKCGEEAKEMCAKIGTPSIMMDATEMEKLQSVAYSCPVNEGAIIEACKARNKNFLSQRKENIGRDCEQRFSFQGEHLQRQCENFNKNQACDEDKYMKKCLADFGVKNENVCPKYPVPECREGVLKTRKDSNGCEYPYCEEKKCPEVQKPACNPDENLQANFDKENCVSGYQCVKQQKVCQDDVKQCSDGTIARRVLPNCDFAECPVFKCPEPQMPKCDLGTVQKKTDDKGCAYYYCEYQKCSEVQKPSCAEGERITAYYDNAGCISSYECKKYEAACNAVEKPSCAEGQSTTAKYDEKGCIAAYECMTIQSSRDSITGYAAAEDYEPKCRNLWSEQKNICSRQNDMCDKAVFIGKCREQELKNTEDFEKKLEKNCEHETIPLIKSAEDRCSRLDKERQKCKEQSEKRCSQMSGLRAKCAELMTEEKVREFIISEAKKRCKFSGIMEDEQEIKKENRKEIVLAVLNAATEDDIEKLGLYVEGLKEQLRLQDTTVYKGFIDPKSFGDIKLMPFVVNAKLSSASSSERSKEVKEEIVVREKAFEAASKLASLRDSDVPDEYLYIIEDKANEVLDAAESLETLEKKEEEKGVGYKIRLFLGLAKAAEKEEITQLEENKKKLQNSIDALEKLVEEVPSDVAKAILKEQVDNLKSQKEEIDALIGTKEKKSKGLFGIFG